MLVENRAGVPSPLRNAISSRSSPRRRHPCSDDLRKIGIATSRRLGSYDAERSGIRRCLGKIEILRMFATLLRSKGTGESQFRPAAADLVFDSLYREPSRYPLNVRLGSSVQKKIKSSDRDDQITSRQTAFARTSPFLQSEIIVQNETSCYSVTYCLGAIRFLHRGETVCPLRKGKCCRRRGTKFSRRIGAKKEHNEQIIPSSCTYLGDLRRELDHLMCDTSRNDPNNCNSGQCERIVPAHDDHNYGDHRRSSRQRAGRHSACGRDRDSVSVQTSGRCDRSSGVVCPPFPVGVRASGSCPLNTRF